MVAIEASGTKLYTTTMSISEIVATAEASQRNTSLAHGLRLKNSPTVSWEKAIAAPIAWMKRTS